jgi:hypothetical protein
MSFRVFASILAIASAITLVPPWEGRARAAADLGGETIGDVVGTLGEAAGAIGTIGDASAKQGRFARAQEQYLFRDIVARSAREMRFLYDARLSSKVAGLGAEPSAAIAGFVEKARDASFDPEATIMPRIDAVFASANAMFTKLEGDQRHPIIYGMLSKDLRDDPEAPNAGLDIFAFDAVDPGLEKNPLIQIEKFDVPANLITVKDDHVLVEIPAAERDAIQYGRMPCEPRETFAVLLTVYATQTHGVWPVAWKTQILSNFELHALPSPKNFEITASYDFTRVVTASRTETYSEKSPYVLAGCDEKVSTSVRFDAPAGATDVTCSASWVDAEAARDQTQTCKVDGASVQGHGAFAGLPKTCSTHGLCACAETGRGWLQIGGTYKVPSASTENVIAAPLGHFVMPAESRADIPVAPGDATELMHIGLTIHRKSCPDIFDRLDMFFPNGTRDGVKAVSKGGQFRATYASGHLRIRHSTSQTSLGDDESE